MFTSHWLTVVIAACMSNRVSATGPRMIAPKTESIWALMSGYSNGAWDAEPTGRVPVTWFTSENCSADTEYNAIYPGQTVGDLNGVFGQDQTHLNPLAVQGPQAVWSEKNIGNEINDDLRKQDIRGGLTQVSQDKQDRYQSFLVREGYHCYFAYVSGAEGYAEPGYAVNVPGPVTLEEEDWFMAPASEQLKTYTMDFLGNCYSAHADGRDVIDSSWDNGHFFCTKGLAVDTYKGNWTIINDKENDAFKAAWEEKENHERKMNTMRSFKFGITDD